uniref:Uncharacterized protein n=1 Tax=Arabidopsis thaliana TaxID=3702 RepID=Q1KS76_ARATH|nr:unknown [Arabidopsis thaliana]
MDLLLMEFTTYTDLVLLFKMLVSLFFQHLGKIKHFSVKLCLSLSLDHLSCGHFILLFPTVKRFVQF